MYFLTLIPSGLYYLISDTSLLPDSAWLWALNRFCADFNYLCRSETPSFVAFQRFRNYRNQSLSLCLHYSDMQICQYRNSLTPSLRLHCSSMQIC
jgi:hypothetical protein